MILKFLINDALDTIIVWLYAVRHMVNEHSDRERKPVAVTSWATLSS